MLSVKEPIWISHRGLCLDFLENTFEAFRAAKEVGFQVLETDLRLTKDNKIVLLHDEDLSRISQAKYSGLVHEHTSDDLKSLVLPQNAKIYFLEEFMQDFQDMDWVFDVKPESATKLIKVLESIFLIKPELLKKINFLFWKKEHQEVFLNLFPNAKCFSREIQCYRTNLAFLLGLGFLSGVKKGETYSIPPSFKSINLLTKSQVNHFHNRGAKVIAYLPETKEEIRMAKEAGCDYIISNVPKE
jgi:glycerophosphoryl diester phosphodiesterase